MANILSKQQALERILSTDKEFLTPAEVAPILGVDPHSIRVAARQHPDSLKFDFIRLGNRTKIPRIPFLRYIGINIDNTVVKNPAAPDATMLPKECMAEIDLLLTIMHQLNDLKAEINERFTRIEKQTQDLNNLLVLAKKLVRALSEIPHT